MEITMTETEIVLFVATSLLLIITPGQDMILVMSRSISQGSKAGIATAAGVCIGLLGHTILAALGLGAVLRASEILFTIVKLTGAAYLIYLGIGLLQTRHGEIEIRGMADASLSSLFLQGAVSNLSNPKVAIFYLAYLPQFIPAETAHPTPMLLALGAVFAALTFLVKAPIGYEAGALSSWLRSRPSVQAWVNRISGGVLVALGLRLAFERRT
jgi:threonine/homoserine/homoserine lactone efflux protein